MAYTHSSTTAELPIRQGTGMSAFSDDAVPETDPTTTTGILAERLQAWKHAITYLEEYMDSVEKIHKVQAKEYEKVLKTISKPLREGQHFDQSLGGVAGFFENMRQNTQALVNTNAETEQSIRGSVLPILERLHKEIKNKSKELAHGALKAAKEVEKARNTTQKHIELLGQNTASFESTGGKLASGDDPYVVHRGVIHRLNKQVLEENNHRNDLLAVQSNSQAFEAHVVHTIQQAMEAFNQFAGGQAEKSRALYSDMLGAAQRIPASFEWDRFIQRNGDVLINPNEAPRTAESIHFANMDHASTKPLIEGSLERKSRNKLSWGTQTGYYVVTPSKFLHEFKDSDNLRNDPKPELSIYLPDATIGAVSGDKFHVKGKDRSKGMSGKLTGSSELSFKAHTHADAEKWYEVIKSVAGATGPAEPDTEPNTPVAATGPGFGREEVLPVGVAAEEKPHPTLATGAHHGQEAGVIGGHTVASPTTLSGPQSTTIAGTAGIGSIGTVNPHGSAGASPVTPATAHGGEKPSMA